MSAATSSTVTTPLSQLFTEHAARPWLFVRPGGNWGDHLIYAGAERLATDAGLHWTTCTSETLPDTPLSADHCIYLHGGGGYNSWCSGRPFGNLAHAVAQDVGLVVQGPQSTEADPEPLRARFNTALVNIRCSDVVFFARELTSYKTLQALALEDRGVRLALDHDTAFHLQPDDLCRLAELETIPKGRYTLTVSRKDNERPQAGRSRPCRAKGVVLDPAYVAKSFGHWLRIHLYASGIITNRLHSAIIGTIAGKRVTLGPGAYHKNHSVWEFSLADRGTEWAEDACVSAGNDLSWLPEIVRNSYKVQKLRLWIHGVPLR